MTGAFFMCERCGAAERSGDGAYHDGAILCCSCAEVVLFWETIDNDGGEE
jgi:formylmethanofuran dehydrogenase subunit E